MLKVLFTCGGTGGHIYPAIALYNEFISRIPDMEYLFVGSDYGLEREIMAHEGLRMEFIQSRGIKRSLSISNLLAVFYNLKAFFQAKAIINRFQPDLVISTGAYPTFHITFYAVRKRIPVFLIESNVMPGLVTRLYSNKASKVYVSSRQTLQYLKDPSRVEITGTPSRIQPPKKTREEIFEELGFDPAKKTVIVVGGSCGAEKINDSLRDLISSSELPYQILWATGKKFYAYVKEHISVKTNHIRIVDYINNMNEVLSIADLMVCRAGAMTIGEIKEFRVPAILIPFEQAAGNHQYINALELQKTGCAIILEEKKLTGNLLYKSIESILSDAELLNKMRNNYDKTLIDNSNKKIYESIMKEMGS